jgi:nicotinate-nucleotide adenylyltransferase
VKKTGLFGGSFDPVHLAHLSLAHCAVDQLGLDQLLWVPAGNPWQKPGVSDAVHRLAMVQLLIDGEARFAIDDSELKREGASFTIDTVRHHLTSKPDGSLDELFLIIGQDQYARFHTWRDWEQLLSRVTLAVAARAGQEVRGAAEVQAVPHRMQKLAMPAMQISSTQVREMSSRGEDIRPLVGDAVAGYIARHRLYVSK